MKASHFFSQYFETIDQQLKSINSAQLKQVASMVLETHQAGKKIIVVGNGGSASIANHVSVDFVKVAKVKSSTFNNSNFITCFANDYGYENWVKEAIKSYCHKNDLLILISSSGKSPNIVNAAHYCRKANIDLITFSGFNKDNELSKFGKINFHVDSGEIILKASRTLNKRQCL